MKTKETETKTKQGFNCGKVTGPVQLSLGGSVDPVEVISMCIVRKAVSSEKIAREQLKKHSEITGTMGQQHVIPYGLYTQEAWVDPHWAIKTQFTYSDLYLFFEGWLRAFEFDHAAARGKMRMRKIFVFEHPGKLGGCS